MESDMDMAYRLVQLKRLINEKHLRTNGCEIILTEDILSLR
jgi:hypothetical protein